MPLINGQKMACEPCIRGHRSTKCSHANERLMVPVRRPGRPLSSCPHPPSRPCFCAAVTAAIPKKQRCHCDTSDESADGQTKTEIEDATGADVAPAQHKQQQQQQQQQPSQQLQQSSSKAPESAPGPCHRVQKSISKSKSGKRPSIDPAALERIDASQVNIVSAFDAGCSKSPPPSRGSGAAGATTPSFGNTACGAVQFVPHDAASAALSLSQPQSHPHPQPPSLSPSNGHSGPQHSAVDVGAAADAAVAAAEGSDPLTNGRNRSSSDTSTNGHLNGDGILPREDSAGQSPSRLNGVQVRQKSCCCATTETTEVGSQGSTSHTSRIQGYSIQAQEAQPGPKLQSPAHALEEQHHQMNGGMMSPMPAQLAAHHGMFPFYPQQTSVFAYPPQCGSYLQPLQPEQWRHLTGNTTFSMPVPDPAYAHFQPTPMPMSVPMSMSMPMSMTEPMAIPAPGHMNGSSWTSHQCGCGDSCQCIGCASHPYNEATQDYVRSAWNMMMMEESPRQKPLSHPSLHEADHGNGNSHSIENGNGIGMPMNHTPLSNGTGTGASAGAGTGTHTPMVVKTNDDSVTAPSSAGRTPSDSAPGAYEEQILSANDFFFVSYPFRVCEGEMVSCPCGDDCACDGCVIHSRSASQAQL